MGKFIIALDQGTTSSRALLFDEKANPLAVEQREFNQIFPKPGWVEHDPLEIWNTQLSVLSSLIANNGVKAGEITAIGITNQRETLVLWDKQTGQPVFNAIVWQDKRTSKLCDHLKEAGWEQYVRENTGLVIDSYFSATKIKWLLDNVEGARKRAERGELLAGTIDTWLIWKLTGGASHVTDVTNASRTMIFNIKTLEWDKKLLEILDIPECILPEVRPSAGHFGDWTFQGVKIPVTGVAGDQQAALFGQTCFEKGSAKNTYGTGCFMLMNTGNVMQLSRNGLVTTIASQVGNEVQYALEGSVFVAGAAVQWLRDGLKVIKSAGETEALAESVKESHDVVVVPAFTGLGAPYWDMYARGAIFGLTRDTETKHLVKATLDSLAYQTKDILEAMQKDASVPLAALKVDGGAVANNYLMQFQADILGVEVL
ncbi:MAG: glycerol kinase GlpK, partial [Cyclobacteriaceae bacterium]|nr:glycerol kinase GlpK [Cyclobacteriaceae bacterium]